MGANKRLFARLWSDECGNSGGGDGTGGDGGSGLGGDNTC